MTLAEVELMNRGFDRMGDTLLKNRMMQEQRTQRDIENKDRAAGRKLEERRVAATEKSAEANDEMRKAMLEDRKTQEAIAQVRNQINDVTERHRAGQMSTADANKLISQIRTRIEQGTNLIVRESGLANFNLQDIPKKDTGQMETAATRNLSKRLELELAVQEAKTPEAKASAERALELWKEERGGSGETERVTEYEREPESGDLMRTRSRSVRGGAGAGAGGQDKGPTGFPLPEKEKDLVTGRKYKTSRGLATWNGTAFVKQ